MEIIKNSVSLDSLKKMAAAYFGNVVKAVVDVDRGCIALDAELHSDLEALLLDKGSKQKSLWGINLYPGLEGAGLIEYDSMINMRPSQGNKSRGIDNTKIRNKIADIVTEKIAR